MLKLEQIDPARFAFFEKRIHEDEDKEDPDCGLTCQFTDTGMIHIRKISGMLGTEPNTIHKHNKFCVNEFEEKVTRIPPGYEKVDPPCDWWMKRCFYNPNMKYLEPTKVPEYDQKHYFIHDNGGRPFIIYLSGETAVVYKIPDESNDYYVRDEDYSNKKIRRQLYQHKVYECKYENAFIGESPYDDFTDFGGGHGPDFTGNSVLLHIGGLEYVYVSIRILKFEALSPIVKYQSSVGNNNVPYPYAVDDQDRYYMMLDGVIMDKVDLQGKHPYNVYYDMTRCLCVNFKDKSYGDYKGFYIGEDPYRLTWSPDPGRDFQRLIENNDKNPVDMFFLKKDGTKQLLTQEFYVKFMNDYAKHCNFTVFVTETIQDRL